MADPSETAPDDAEDAPASRRRKRLLLVGVAVSVLALGAGGWIGFSGMLSSKPGKEAAAQPAHGGKEGADHGAAAGTGAGAGDVALLDFKDLVVNVAGSSASGAPAGRILRIGFAMAYADPEHNARTMTEKQPYLRDAILSYLRQLHEADLRGSDGLFLLKAELLKRARAVVGGDAPQEFLITDLVMQ